MSDTVKLIIEIPKDYYEALSKTKEIISSQRSGKTLMSIIYSAVANGIPLDDVKAEIEDLDRYYDNDYFSTNNCPMYKCNEVLQILDNIGKAESEDKE